MREQNLTVGIVTIEDYINYGNRLQNIAVTRLLEDEGISVINGLYVATKQDYVQYSQRKVKKFLKGILPFRVVRPRIAPSKPQYFGLKKQRERNFKLYVGQYIRAIAPIITSTYRQAMKAAVAYKIDFFITGSDQVWNPYYEGRNDEFLTFAPKDKRLSFAASMGVDKIPADKVERYRKNLSEMKYLSVREQRAVEIIKELTGRDADLTLDPTLLLEPEKWQDAVKKPEIVLETPYICTYFLGEVPEAVEAFARKKDLPIYALNSEEHPELFTLDPGEFLYMIQNAAYVLTDSFHAVAFSIKFHKEFYVFDRKQTGVESMFSRIETITKRFELQNRIQSRGRIEEQAPISHWKEIDQILLNEKTRSMKRLLEAMET